MKPTPPDRYRIEPEGRAPVTRSMKTAAMVLAWEVSLRESVTVRVIDSVTKKEVFCVAGKLS